MAQSCGATEPIDQSEIDSFKLHDDTYIEGEQMCQRIERFVQGRGLQGKIDQIRVDIGFPTKVFHLKQSN